MATMPEPMLMYVRFVTCLAAGLAGIGLVMKVVIETLFHDWDVVADLGALFRYYFEEGHTVRHERAEDKLLADERVRAEGGAEPSKLELKRQQLKELASVENRLKRPGPVHLTPLPPPRVPAE